MESGFFSCSGIGGIITAINKKKCIVCYKGLLGCYVFFDLKSRFLIILTLLFNVIITLIFRNKCADYVNFIAQPKVLF